MNELTCVLIAGEGLQQLAAALQAALQQLDSGSNHQQQQVGAAAADDGEGRGIAAAVSAAFGQTLSAKGNSTWQQAAHPQDHKMQQAVDADDADLASDGEQAFAEEYELEDQEEEWEEEEGEEWEAVDLARSASVSNPAQQSGSSSSRTEPSADNDAPPASLAVDDPDRWLFDLTEEQLLELADKVD